MVSISRLLVALLALAGLSACAAPVTPTPRDTVDSARSLLIHNGVVVAMITAQLQAGDGLWLILLGAAVVAECVLGTAWHESWPSGAGMLIGVVAHGVDVALSGSYTPTAEPRVVSTWAAARRAAGQTWPRAAQEHGAGHVPPVLVLALALGGWKLMRVFWRWQRNRSRTWLPRTQAVPA